MPPLPPTWPGPSCCVADREPKRVGHTLHEPPNQGALAHTGGAADDQGGLGAHHLTQE